MSGVVEDLAIVCTRQAGVLARAAFRQVRGTKHASREPKQGGERPSVLEHELGPSMLYHIEELKRAHAIMAILEDLQESRRV